MVNPQSKAAFCIDNWRESVQTRREMIRSIIVRSVVGGEQLEPMLHQLKKDVSYTRLDERDRNLIKVIVYDVRTVVGGWRHLPPSLQQQFVSGQIAPSSIASKIREISR